MVKVGKISGFPEWLPEQKIAEDRVVATIKRIFESYGFAPIETPAVELLSTLGSKGISEKEIFVVRRLKADEGQESELGLHFDLTVPLARYVAQHQAALTFPFKRYQCQKVWRGERPQRGRFREFYQFDIDIIGRDELPLSCDAEVVSVIGLVMKELNFGPFQVRINSRKLLGGLYAELGLDEAARKAAIVAVDKLLKIGADGVQAELEKIPGISPKAIEVILKSTEIQCDAAQLPGKIAALGFSSDQISQGVAELVDIFGLIPEDVQPHVVIDVSLARGLDYYTGLIAETTLTKYPEFGSVFSGGRYDDLASEFTTQKLPGVGVSIGLSRIMDLALSEGLVPTDRKSPTRAVVAVYSEDTRKRCNDVAHALRQAGLPTEVFYKSPKLGKQIEYAELKGARYVLFVDGATGEVQAKDLVTKEQAKITDLTAWAKSVAQ
jgi:histidyl-tRNA synthetase